MARCFQRCVPRCPLLGTTAGLLGQDALVGVAGFLLASLAPQGPIGLGVPGCALHVSAASFVVLHSVPGSSTTWTFGLPIPPFQQLLGLELALQSLYGPTLGPVGADLSNGVKLRLGY